MIKFINSEQATHGSSRTTVRALVFACTFLGFANILWNASLQVDVSRSTLEFAELSSMFISSHDDTKICSHMSALYNGNLSSVTDAIRQADDFHFGGGSLKAVQEYLDRQIPATLERLQIAYDPTEKMQQNSNLPVDEYLRQYFATHDVPRGGYGQPLPLTFKSDNHNVLQTAFHRDRVQHRWMDVIETWTHERFQVAVGPELPPCPHLAKFSEGTYEAKNFCVPGPSEQQRTDSNGDCHVFSIGSNDQWGFEEELLQKLPGCHVHTFDCTLKDNTPLKKPNDPRVHFYPHCVSGKNSDSDGNDNNNNTTSTASNAKSYKSYHGLVQATGIQHPPKVLKMDIEGFEFDVLSSMLKSSPPTLWPQEIMMEVHFGSRMIDLTWLLRTRQTAEMAMFFDLLYNKGGYMPAHIKYINGCPTCMEILLVRVHCAEEG